MFDGKMKAITFSYDDGVLQDERLINIFNKYNLKGTFNINSELLGKEGSVASFGTMVKHVKFKPEEIRTIYKGHEVAVHTLTHSNLSVKDEIEIIRQVEDDRVNLSRLVGYEVCGMAYPGGHSDERVAEIIKKKTNVKYSRTVISTRSFELQNDLYEFHPTVHHANWDELQELVRRFIDLKADTPALFYIWGHSYEFDAQNTWERFEDICKDLSNRDDVFYGTNREVLGI